MKTKFIDELLDYFVVQKKHHVFRVPAENEYELAEKFAENEYDDMKRSVERLRYVLEKEKPIVFKNERITFLRTVKTIPRIHTEEEDQALHQTHAFHENGAVFNMCPDYAMLMEDGFGKKREKILQQMKLAETEKQKEFLQHIYVKFLDRSCHEDVESGLHN